MTVSYIAESLEDIAKTFESFERLEPLESTRAAQIYRNGRAQGIRECVAMMRSMRFKPRTHLMEAIAQLRMDHLAGKQLPLPDFTVMSNSPGAVADWLELFTDQFHPDSSPPPRVFLVTEVIRKDSGGKLYAPVDQHGRESGDTPSYDPVIIQTRCDQLNGKA